MELDENLNFVLHNELNQLREQIRSLHNLKEVTVNYEIMIRNNTTLESFSLGFIDSNYGPLETLCLELRSLLKDYGDYHVWLNGFAVNRHKDDYLELAEQFAQGKRHVNAQESV